jgi:addiction module RelE/StbE family toxin
MKVIIHRIFSKAIKKIPNSVKSKYLEHSALFEKNPTDERLNNHALTGKYLGYRSINIGSDWRIIFKELNSQTVIFVDIGTHSQLYG